ncbi:hypothetical protein L9F63_007388 [Diploptera punctata]|uniref:Lipocalin/cytosolic fatty-acid binding domain-containing protein n=1 Tax=Diploptera punctata TaxID=6984 RepID=A0AAD8E3Z0_DIPPU|nr:hypothetical protein L9F63_007388 [Diploptera punctata]
MAKILLYVVICFLASSANGCNIGKRIINDFDMEKALGYWFLLYYPKEFGDKYSCYRDIYGKDDNGYTINSTIVLTSGETVVYLGTITMDDNIINIKYNTFDELSTGYRVLAADYDNYVIISGCPPGEKEVLTYMQFRSQNPDDIVMKNVEEALEQTGSKMKDYVKTTCPLQDPYR